MGQVVALDALLDGQRVWRGQPVARPRARQPTGHAALDDALPEGGWPEAALTELLLPADGIGELRSTLRARYGEKVRTPLIAAERSLLGRRMPGVGLAEAVANPSGLADDLISALEARALWSRYGL